MKDFINNHNGLFVLLICMAPLCFAGFILLLGVIKDLLHMLMQGILGLHEKEKKELTDIIDSEILYMTTDDVIQKGYYGPVNKQRVRELEYLKKKISRK